MEFDCFCAESYQRTKNYFPPQYNTLPQCKELIRDIRDEVFETDMLIDSGNGTMLSLYLCSHVFDNKAHIRTDDFAGPSFAKIAAANKRHNSH
jgi:hypothetical protein